MVPLVPPSVGACVSSGVSDRRVNGPLPCYATIASSSSIDWQYNWEWGTARHREPHWNAPFRLVWRSVVTVAIFFNSNRCQDSITPLDPSCSRIHGTMLHSTTLALLIEIPSRLHHLTLSHTIVMVQLHCHRHQY